ELSPGEYVDFSCWDDKVLGRDEYGDEIPLPAEARRVTRSFRGAYLIRAAASMLGDEIDRIDNPGELSA
ncbi:hypothetical protein, partial [Archangium violaceum]|uniref:hypothetical protein n=1 Tax=Archangium violaceum TaxID=83451 RepID=UPI0005BBC47D